MVRKQKILTYAFHLERRGCRSCDLRAVPGPANFTVGVTKLRVAGPHIRKDLALRLKAGICLQLCWLLLPFSQVIILYHMTGISHFTSKVTVKVTLIGEMVTLFNLPSFDIGVIRNSYVRALIP